MECWFLQTLLLVENFSFLQSSNVTDPRFTERLLNTTSLFITLLSFSQRLVSSGFLFSASQRGRGRALNAARHRRFVSLSVRSGTIISVQFESTAAGDRTDRQTDRVTDRHNRDGAFTQRAAKGLHY